MMLPSDKMLLGVSVNTRKSVEYGNWWYAILLIQSAAPEGTVVDTQT